MNTPNTLTVQQALSTFFEKNNLGEDGGLNKSWAWLKMGRFYIPFPNPASRKKALMFHDIHHIVTGYESNWRGEVAISAWEVSGGCGEYGAAWVLDLWGFSLGLLVFQQRTFRAFIRGQRTRNLYHHTFTHEQVLGMKIEEVQTALKLNQPNDQLATAKEILAFMQWAIIAAVFGFITFVAPYVLLIWWWMR